MAAEPFGLRGFRLGILLADFKITQFPDQKLWPGARPLCSGDREANAPGGLSTDDGVRVSDAESKAGIVRCGFFHESGGALVPAGLVVAGTKSDVSFVFVPDSDGEMRLATIRVSSASSNYETIKSALIKKYGRPKSVVQGYAHDAAGSRLIDETVRWSNGVSDIRLDQREEDKNIEFMSIEYIHEELAAEGLKRIKAVLGSSANTL
jgi:hypothetical protein